MPGLSAPSVNAQLSPGLKLDRSRACRMIRRLGKFILMSLVGNVRADNSVGIFETTAPVCRGVGEPGLRFEITPTWPALLNVLLRHYNH